MPSSIFGPQTSGNSILAAVNQVRAMAGGNPQALFDQMYQSNPQFKQFADSMQGKTPQQAFREYGIDYEQVRNLF